jgi:hypothetical protein
VAAELNLAGHQWAEPSVAHLRQLMRRVFERPDEAAERGQAARERMVREYSPEALATRAVEAVRESRQRVRAHLEHEAEEGAVRHDEMPSGKEEL